MKRFDFDHQPGTAGVVPGAGQAGRRHHGPAGLLVLALLVAVLAASALPALAANGGPPITAPWDSAITTALSDPPYAPDPGFNNGNYFLDEFYSNPTADNNYFEGKKVVRLSNGDIVVAALVKNPNGNQSNGFWNIGLVRYNAAGTQRVVWPNGGAYAHVNGQYIVYPKLSTATYTRIGGLDVYGNNILVAVNAKVGNDEDSRILVFGTDGAFKSNTDAFDSYADEYIGGMAVYTSAITFPAPVSVVVVGHKYVTGVGFRPLFRRFTLNTSGTLTDVTNVVDLNTHWCANTSRDCAPVGIALGLRAGGNPAIYVVNRGVDTAFSPARVCATVTKVDSAGVADSSWPSNYCDAFDDGSNNTTTKANNPVAIAVDTTGIGSPGSPFRDNVFVLSEIERKCANGALVERYDDDYIPTGGAVFGGATSNFQGLCVHGQGPDLPRGMVMSDGRLAVVGYGSFTTLTNPPVTNYTAWAAILDVSGAAGATLRDFTDYPYPSGANYRDTALSGIVATTNGKFVVTGDARYPNTASVPANLRGKNAVATLGIAPDRIFSDGFDGDGSSPPQPAQFRGTNIGNMTMIYSQCDNGGNGPVPDVSFHTFDSRLVDYYANKGMKALRVEFAWECMQKELNGPIPAVANGNYKTYFDTVKALADYASNVKGMQVVLTPWASTAGGGVCGACYKGQLISPAPGAAVNSTHFADFWTKMANHFKSNPKVAFDLINEPHDMSTMDWFSIAQVAVTAIRATGATNRIYVPGNGYTAAASWEMNYYDTAATQRSNAYGWLNARGAGLPLQDTLNNTVVEVHSYADGTKGGLDNGITSATVLRDDVKVPVDWARAHGLKVYVAEVAVFHGNALAAQTWNNFVTYAGANTDTLIGFTWWAGGYPGWWDDVNAPTFSITPTDAGTYTGDSANMDMIEGAFQ
ncbi:glycoside hydrolase family 5 protein [Dokdonella sp.]|uniref:glycoside hydrolase family 5 protein n=1 Tax=Dokdonella sp. TaxID=2291710 RepID=UPI0027BB0BF2|nr:glycoside hydrolase family 5 protein [Dokdonella sp.]